MRIPFTVDRRNWDAGWLSRYDTLDRRGKVRWWFARYGNQWDDWLCQRGDGGILGWLSNKDWAYFDGGWSRLVCLVIGHNPIEDHCGKPEHDYCSTCSKRIPRG